MPEVTIRRAVPEDAPVCGTICYEAFRDINAAHNFPPDLPSPEAGIRVLSTMFSHPGFYGVVAESGGRIIGSNCLDERSPIAGVGPITVATNAQNAGAGRKLMDAVLARSRERGFAGVRLLQAAFHNRSLSLYTKLGFDAREPVSVMFGTAVGAAAASGQYRIRPAVASDLEACNQVCIGIHGHHRGGDLADAIQQGTAKVVERNGRIAAYTSAMTFFGHSVASNREDLQALIASAGNLDGPGILVPTRNGPLFRWCLESGLRVKYPMTLMTLGMYQEPAGAYLPAILF